MADTWCKSGHDRNGLVQQQQRVPAAAPAPALDAPELLGIRAEQAAMKQEYSKMEAKLREMEERLRQKARPALKLNSCHGSHSGAVDLLIWSPTSLEGAPRQNVHPTSHQAGPRALESVLGIKTVSVRSLAIGTVLNAF